MLKTGLLKNLVGYSSKNSKPFKREMLSRELLALRGMDLAKEHLSISDNAKGIKLKQRFRGNYQVLNTVYFSLSDIAQHQGFLAAGADWLLDNYHVIDEQVREIRRDLPSGYYNALPKITSGVWKGYPRVYSIACDYLEHTDSLVQLDTLSEYIGAYQKSSPLKLCELWAIPIMLRLAIVENIRLLSESILELSIQRQESEELFEEIVESEEVTSIQILNNLLENLAANLSTVSGIIASAPLIKET
jgi:cyclic beta-1,2-glucan synthetase